MKFRSFAVFVQEIKLSDCPGSQEQGEEYLIRQFHCPGEQPVNNSLEGKKQFAVLLLDLDRFKEINDTLGHHAGDHLLQAFAELPLGPRTRFVQRFLVLGAARFDRRAAPACLQFDARPLGLLPGEDHAVVHGGVEGVLDHHLEHEVDAAAQVETQAQALVGQDPTGRPRLLRREVGEGEEADERHQQADGGFEGQGWAPVLSQSIAGKGGARNFIVVEIPKSRATIHLDMIFTMADRDTCVVFSPLITDLHKCRAFHVNFDQRRVKRIIEYPGVLEALRTQGLDLKPIACGGDDALYRRILPYAGLIRTDTFGKPVVIPGDAIYLQRVDHELGAMRLVARADADAAGRRRPRPRRPRRLRAGSQPSHRARRSP